MSEVTKLANGWEFVDFLEARKRIPLTDLVLSIAPAYVGRGGHDMSKWQVLVIKPRVTTDVVMHDTVQHSAFEHTSGFDVEIEENEVDIASFTVRTDNEDTCWFDACIGAEKAFMALGDAK